MPARQLCYEEISRPPRQWPIPLTLQPPAKPKTRGLKSRSTLWRCRGTSIAPRHLLSRTAEEQLMQRWCSSSAQTFLAGLEEFSERIAIRLVRANLDRIDV